MSLDALYAENSIELPYLVYKMGNTHVVIGSNMSNMKKSFVGEKAPYKNKKNKRQLVFCLIEESDILFSFRDEEDFVSMNTSENMTLLTQLGQLSSALRDFYVRNRYAQKSVRSKLSVCSGISAQTSGVISHILDGPLNIRESDLRDPRKIPKIAS